MMNAKSESIKNHKNLREKKIVKERKTKKENKTKQNLNCDTPQRHNFDRNSHPTVNISATTY